MYEKALVVSFHLNISNFLTFSERERMVMFHELQRPSKQKSLVIWDANN